MLALDADVVAEARHIQLEFKLSVCNKVEFLDTPGHMHKTCVCGIQHTLAFKIRRTHVHLDSDLLLLALDADAAAQVRPQALHIQLEFLGSVCANPIGFLAFLHTLHHRRKYSNHFLLNRLLI